MPFFGGDDAFRAVVRVGSALSDDELLLSDDELLLTDDDEGSAAAVAQPHPNATADPMPSATAKPPTCPMYPADPICHI